MSKRINRDGVVFRGVPAGQLPWIKPDGYGVPAALRDTPDAPLRVQYWKGRIVEGPARDFLHLKAWHFAAHPNHRIVRFYYLDLDHNL